MAEGVLSNLVAKALELLATSAFKEASSWWGARDDLKKLGKSMEMIQARVRDAEKYQEEEGSDAVKLWLRSLKLVLYQADDLFDRILTVDRQKQRRKQNHEVHFSLRSSSPVLNWNIARDIKSIREQLDAINSDMAGLNLRVYDHGEEPQPLIFQSLRVLSLKGSGIKRLPDSIGRLIHVRYLNLRNSDIEYLPQAITRLENLQALNLHGCIKLKELPIDFTNLPNLRHLAIAGSGLTTFPPGFGTMTSLQELDEFIVGDNNGIDSVPALNHTGNLHIKFCKWRNDAVMEAQRANLKGSERLSNLTLDWKLMREATPTSSGMNEMLMYLQLPPNLIYLRVDNYSGYEMQCRWLDVLSKLVSIIISECRNCRVLPHLRQLPHLKNLTLERLDTLEYIEDECDIWVGGDCGHTTHYFPTLEVLELDGLPRLKEWTRPSKSGGEQRRQLLFPRLLHIKVEDCKELVLMPLAPKLESLSVIEGNGKLFESNLASPNDEASSSLFTSLKYLLIKGTKNGLVSLSISSRLCKLESVEIRNCEELRSLMIESPSSIRDLKLIGVNCGICNILTGDFPFIETLEIWGSSEELEEGNTSMYWQGLRNLRHLRLCKFKNLKKLPPGIACLTNLINLDIRL
ncbi:hypothetical protein BVRB_2g031590 [Beta vulgaris subsp. vulgaris]|uniref:Uncharacterized protein n=1 Tax=Beta vulgaris subsp. vulgaris TaxID=3555 RepID=A0A0J8CWN2_BETVV|nr:hypothetical protein BVRB_2g031590 [Beta vulgaris subsp. vulgaris]